MGVKNIAMTIQAIEARVKAHYVDFDGTSITYLGPDQMVKDVQYLLDSVHAYANALAGVNGADLDGGE